MAALLYDDAHYGDALHYDGAHYGGAAYGGAVLWRRCLCLLPMTALYYGGAAYGGVALPMAALCYDGMVARPIPTYRRRASAGTQVELSWATLGNTMHTVLSVSAVPEGDIAPSIAFTEPQVGGGAEDVVVVARSRFSHTH